MKNTERIVGKREFIQHTSQYLKWVEEHDKPLIITHRHLPDLVLTKIKRKKISDLKGLTTVKIKGDVNEPVLPGYDEWLS